MYGFEPQTQTWESSSEREGEPRIWDSGFRPCAKVEDPSIGCTIIEAPFDFVVGTWVHDDSKVPTFLAAVAIDPLEAILLLRLV